MNLAGIKVNKDEFVARMKQRFGERQTEKKGGRLSKDVDPFHPQSLRGPIADAPRPSPLLSCSCQDRQLAPA